MQEVIVKYFKYVGQYFEEVCIDEDDDLFVGERFMNLEELVVKVFGEVDIDYLICVIDIDCEVFFYELIVDISEFNQRRNFRMEFIESYNLMEMIESDDDEDID